MRARSVVAVVLTTVLLFGVFLAGVLGLLAVSERGGPFAFGGDRVAVIEIEGLIVDPLPVVRELEEHRDDPSVRAVVVRIDSPGGVVGPSQEIYEAIRRVRAKDKPVVASLGAVAASGGYYIAAAADRIVANPGTLTGSIGVIMHLAELEGLFKKIGVRYEVIKSGRYKDLGSFARRMTQDERRLLQDLLDDVHLQFVEAVAEGRGLDREVVLALADGRIFSGRQARGLQLVDALGGLQEAVELAAELGGIPGKPRVLYPRRPFSLLDLARWLIGDRGALPALGLLRSTKTPLYLME
ncbi:MAG: signal peptide peptidase SppA [Candidatus Rokubacteria bacterium]|nr:signal peptide peptidase SppA [Candidatus Rokubacteria bacterium]